MNILVNLDSRSPKPLYRQLVDELKVAIQDGYLKPGERLLSTRDLGKSLGISRFTVTRCYEDLVSSGYLKIATGSGAYVTDDIPVTEAADSFEPGSPSPPVESLPDKLPLSRVGQQSIRAAQFAPVATDFRPELNCGAPDYELLPVSRWKEVFYLATRTIEMETAADYQDPFGCLDLREAIAGYLGRSRKVRCNANRIAVFTSWQNAFDFLLRLLVDPGDRCTMESPGLPLMYRTLLASGAEVHGLELDECGMKVPDVQQTDGPIKLICINPSCNEATGIAMSAGRRQELLHALGHGHTYIIENDIDHEYKYGRKPVPSMQGMDLSDRVIYMGSFAKLLYPLSRLAYIVLPEHLVPLAFSAKSAWENDYSPLDQKALAAFIADGHLDRHIKRTNEIYAERRAALVLALTLTFGDNVQIVCPTNGTNLLVRFDQSIRSEQLAKAATRHNVSLLSTDRYYPVGPNQNGYLMGFGHLSAESLTANVEALARELARDLAQQLAPGASPAQNPLPASSSYAPGNTGPGAARGCDIVLDDCGRFKALSLRPA